MLVFLCARVSRFGDVRVQLPTGSQLYDLDVLDDAFLAVAGNAGITPSIVGTLSIADARVNITSCVCLSVSPRLPRK